MSLSLQILTGVPWQAVLVNIINGGTVIRIEGQADQREDQGLQKTTSEMQIVEHDGHLFWSLFSLNAIVAGDSYHHGVYCAADDLTTVVAPSWTPPRWIGALQRAVVRQVIPILCLGPHSLLFVLFARSLTPKDRGRDPGPARASLLPTYKKTRSAITIYVVKAAAAFAHHRRLESCTMKEFASADCFLGCGFDKAYIDVDNASSFELIDDCPYSLPSE